MKSFFEETLERVGLAVSDFREKITILGFCGIQIEGHKGLLDFSSERIKVRFSRQNLVICGKNLRVREVTADELFVKGKICSVGIDNDK